MKEKLDRVFDAFINGLIDRVYNYDANYVLIAIAIYYVGTALYRLAESVESLVKRGHLNVN